MPRRRRALLLLVFPTLFCVAPGFAKAASRSAAVPTPSQPQTGAASWHAPIRNSSASRTASGRRWNTGELVAAHRHLPFGTRVAVTHLRTNRSVVVQIIDRGPYIGGRIIDLSQAAAHEIGMLGSGVGKVRLDVLPPQGIAPAVKKAFAAHITVVRSPENKKSKSAKH